MPTYCDKHGRPTPNGDYELKDGRIIVRNGGRVHFDVTLRDSATGPRVFLTDTTDDAQTAVQVARAKMLHDQKFAWLGDQAPAFDEAAARLIIDAEQRSEHARQVRDMVRSARHDGQQAAPDAYAAMCADLRDGRSGSACVRDAVRDARYR